MRLSEVEITEDNTLAAVRRAAASLRSSLSRPALRPIVETCPDLSDAITEAALQMHAPFKVAVSGEVSSGKSSFVNAFLGQDLALVDTNECTAVCSEFEFGKPDSPDKPIHVSYRNGRDDWEPLEFRDRLKGAGAATLDLAEIVDRLVFPIPEESLRGMVLVDTPGLNSVVKEHESTARGSLGTVEDEERKKILSDRNDAETREMASLADAVLWLVSEDVLARALDHLSAFLNGSRAGDSEVRSSVHAFNVMVVLTKSDEKRTQEDRMRVQEDVVRQLNPLLPCEVRCFSVSAGVERLLQKMGRSGIDKLRTILRQDYKAIPPTTIEVRFKMNKYSNGLLSTGMTPSQLGVPKGAFIRAAMILLQAESNEAAWAELEELSGFNMLRKAIADHFSARSAVLKGRIVVAKCQNALHRMVQEGVERTRQRVLLRRKEIGEFTRYVVSHADYRAPTATDYAEHKIGEALREWLSRHTIPDTTDEALRELETFQETFARFQHRFSRSWMRLDGLSALEDVLEGDAPSLSDAELEELKQLFHSVPGAACPHAEPELRTVYWGRRARSCKFGDKAIRTLYGIAAIIYREWCHEEE